MANMAVILKRILNSYTDEELEDYTLWMNNKDPVKSVVVDNYSISFLDEEVDEKIGVLLDN